MNRYTLAIYFTFLSWGLFHENRSKLERLSKAYSEHEITIREIRKNCQTRKCIQSSCSQVAKLCDIPPVKSLTHLLVNAPVDMQFKPGSHPQPSFS